MLVGFGLLALGFSVAALREDGWSPRRGVVAFIGLGLVVVGAERARRLLRNA
jgi:hypothetical protein